MITPVEMQDVETIFLTSINQSLSRILDEGRQRVVNEFLLRLSYDFKAQWLISPQGLGSIIPYVFESEVHTDFIQTVTYNFLARWAADPTRFDALALVLSTACSIDKDTAHAGTPEVYSSRLTEQADVFATLKANKWLVTVLLILLYVNLGESNDNKKR